MFLGFGKRPCYIRSFGDLLLLLLLLLKDIKRSFEPTKREVTFAVGNTLVSDNLTVRIGRKRGFKGLPSTVRSAKPFVIRLVFDAFVPSEKLVSWLKRDLSCLLSFR